VARVKDRGRPAHRTNAGGSGGKGELGPWAEEASQPRGRCRGRGGHRWGADVGGSVRRHGGGGPNTARLLPVRPRPCGGARAPFKAAERLPTADPGRGGWRPPDPSNGRQDGGGRQQISAARGREAWPGEALADEFCGWEEAASFALEAADRGRLTRSAVGPGSGPIPWVHFPYCSNQTHEIQTRKFFPSSQPNTRKYGHVWHQLLSNDSF